MLHLACAAFVFVALHLACKGHFVKKGCSYFLTRRSRTILAEILILLYLSRSHTANGTPQRKQSTRARAHTNRLPSCIYLGRYYGDAASSTFASWPCWCRRIRSNSTCTTATGRESPNGPTKRNRVRPTPARKTKKSSSSSSKETWCRCPCWRIPGCHSRRHIFSRVAGPWGVGAAVRATLTTRWGFFCCCCCCRCGCGRCCRSLPAVSAAFLTLFFGLQQPRCFVICFASIWYSLGWDELLNIYFASRPEGKKKHSGVLNSKTCPLPTPAAALTPISGFCARNARRGVPTTSRVHLGRSAG